MDFYGREEERAELERIRERSLANARFTVVTGRRRVGKTELLERAYHDGRTPYLHFLVTRRSERDLCATFQEEAQRVLGRPFLGRADRFGALFEELLEYAVATPFTLVIDEFQELDRIDPGIFGEIQGAWDRWHGKAKVNLVACGSVNRMMTKIFLDDSQPLYGRNTGRLDVGPFPTAVLRRILADRNPRYSGRDLLALWTLTGGVARYVELFMDVGATTRGAMLDEVFGPSSAYIDEGRVVLSDEFGKEGGVYFSILAAIAAGRTSYGDIRNAVGEEIGGHLTKLERVYGFVSKARPFRGRESGRDFHYRIDDAFFRFWFRFVHRYMHLVEQRQRGALRQIVERDFDVFAGTSLERWFRTKLLEEGRYTRIEGWWDRKGENEIDLVCENEADGTLDFREVKTDPRRLDPQALGLKVAAFFRKNPDLRRERFGVGGLSLDDM